MIGFDELVRAGTPAREAAVLTGLSRATQQRRLQPKPSVTQLVSSGSVPVNKLTDVERLQVLAVLNSPRFVDKPPQQIYATLLAEGHYLCSISTMYRILGENMQVKDRRRQATHPPRAVPELQATGPRQVYSWDITKLAGPVAVPASNFRVSLVTISSSSASSDSSTPRRVSSALSPCQL